MSHPASVSVLVATYNRCGLLKKCLESLVRSSVQPREVIVVDQSDDDESERMMHDMAGGKTLLTYVRAQERGKSKALNEAIQLATGDLLALTDDDVEVDTRWIESILELSSQYPDVAAFCGRILPEPNTDPAGYYNLVLSMEPRWITARTNPLTPAFCGANIVVRRETMLQIGAYNAHFGPGGLFKNNDDGELAYRLVCHGANILYSPDFHVYHSAWRGDTDTLRLKYDYAYSLGAFTGYYLRRWHMRPVVHWSRKTAWKTWRMLRARMTNDRSETRDTGIQLRGLSTGLFHGFRVRDSGTLKIDREVESNGRTRE